MITQFEISKTIKSIEGLIYYDIQEIKDQKGNFLKFFLSKLLLELKINNNKKEKATILLFPGLKKTQYFYKNSKLNKPKIYSEQCKRNLQIVKIPFPLVLRKVLYLG